MMKTGRARGHMKNPSRCPHEDTGKGKCGRPKNIFIIAQKQEKGHPEPTTVHMADAGSPFDSPEGSGRSGPIRRLVSPGGRSAFHGLQVPPTTGNLANPVTDNFQYIRFGYSVQTIGHLFTCSSQSIIRPKKKPSARGMHRRLLSQLADERQFPIYHRTGRLANRGMRKGLPHRTMDIVQKRKENTLQGRPGDSMNLAPLIVHQQPDHIKTRGAAESEEQQHHGPECLKLPSTDHHTPIIGPYKESPLWCR